jgi:hypothetical protein
MSYGIASTREQGRGNGERFKKKGMEKGKGGRVEGWKRGSVEQRVKGNGERER